jgi:hypothetical protein
MYRREAPTAMPFHVKPTFHINIYIHKLIAWFGVTNFPTFSENPKVYYRVKTILLLGPVLIYSYTNPAHTHVNLVDYMA